jgi:hypothetical protein
MGFNERVLYLIIFVFLKKGKNLTNFVIFKKYHNMNSQRINNSPESPHSSAFSSFFSVDV